MNEALVLRKLDEAITLMRRGNAVENDIVKLDALIARMVRRAHGFIGPISSEPCMVPPYVRLQRGHLGD